MRRISRAAEWAGQAHRFEAANVPIAACGECRWSLDDWRPYEDPDVRCAECARLADDTWEGE